MPGQRSSDQPPSLGERNLAQPESPEARRIGELNAALGRSEQILRQLPDALVVANLDGRIEQWLGGATSLFGYTAEEARGRPLGFLRRPEHPAGRTSEILSALEEGSHYRSELTCVRRDGVEIEVELTVQPLTDPLGAPSSLLAIFRDATPRKMAVAQRERLIHELSARTEAEAEQRRLEALLDDAPVPMAIWRGREHRYERFNKLYAQLVGRDDLLGQGLREATGEVFGRKVCELFDAVYRTGEPAALRGIRAGPDQPGQPEQGRFLDLTAHALRDVHGAVEGVIAVVVDVTARIRAQQEFEVYAEGQHNERRWLEAVLDRMPVSTLLLEPGTSRVLFRNQEAKAMMRFAPTSGIGAASGTQAFSQDGRELAPSELPSARAARGEELRDLEVRWRTTEGDRALLVTSASLPAVAGHPATVVLTLQDVSRLKQAEREKDELLLQVERLQRLTAALAAATQPEEIGRVLAEHLATLFGVCGLHLALAREDRLDLAFVESRDAERATLLAPLLASPEATSPALEALRTGQPVWVGSREAFDARYPLLVATRVKAKEATWVALPLHAGTRTVGVLELAFDRAPLAAHELLLTVASQCAQALARWLAFQEEQQLRRQAEELVQQLAANQQLLEQASRAKDEFLAVVSHELRTPLTAMLGWTRMLRSANLPPEKREKALEIIERNTRAQAELINDLLDLSRIISGKLRLEVEPTDLREVALAAAEVVRPSADLKGVALHLELDGGDAIIQGDPDRLQQVIWNLLANGVKFTPSGGEVRARLSCSPSQLELEVRDTGQGISADFLPFVFDRFRQAESALTRTHGGLGLGLAIVRHIVELHGGTVEARSEGPGLGATFAVRLPLKAQLREAPSRPSVRPPSGPQQQLHRPAELKGLRILVVDDERDARELVAEALSQCGAAVQTAASVAEALGRARAEMPELLVSDLGMPGEDGYALIRQLRAQQAAPRVPAVALSAFARSEDRAQALLAGFDVHVAKPIDPGELVLVVAALARSAGMRR